MKTGFVQTVKSKHTAHDGTIGEMNMPWGTVRGHRSLLFIDNLIDDDESGDPNYGVRRLNSSTPNAIASLATINMMHYPVLDIDQSYALMDPAEYIKHWDRFVSDWNAGQSIEHTTIKGTYTGHYFLESISGNIHWYIDRPLYWECYLGFIKGMNDYGVDGKWADLVELRGYGALRYPNIFSTKPGDPFP